MPALHCMHVDAPADDHVPAPHTVHALDDDAPTTDDHMPALHVGAHVMNDDPVR